MMVNLSVLFPIGTGQVGTQASPRAVPTMKSLTLQSETDIPSLNPRARSLAGRGCLGHCSYGTSNPDFVKTVWRAADDAYKYFEKLDVVMLRLSTRLEF